MDNRGNKADGMDGEWQGGGGHRNLHTGGVNGMWPRGKEGQGDLVQGGT